MEQETEGKKKETGAEKTACADEESAAPETAGGQGHGQQEQRVPSSGMRQQLDRVLARESEARGEIQRFMHMLSHDLRSPMSTISNFLGIIMARQGHVLDEKSKQYIGYSLELIKNMSQLLTDTLYYLKLGSRELSMAELDTGRVLQRALFNLREELEKTGGQVSAKDLPRIKGDENLLVQLFQGLISNSLKFFTLGPPMVRISAVRRDHAGRGEWLFSFGDNGSGIKPEDLARIFEPFVRAGTGQGGKGTGLGLAICMKIVELHGGRIWVESVLGEGSTFYFTIPE